MILTERKSYQPSRPIENLEQVYREFQVVSEFTKGRIRFRGIFDDNNVRRMVPPPDVGDLWIQRSVSTGSIVDTAYILVSKRPRRHFEWIGDVKVG